MEETQDEREVERVDEWSGVGQKEEGNIVYCTQGKTGELETRGTETREWRGEKGEERIEQ